MNCKENKKPSGNLGSMMMRIAMVCLCLVLLSFHLMGGLLAKYTSSGNDDDSARVAKFHLVVDGDPDAVTVTAGTSNNSDTYTITVNNDSEVAVEYTITVKCDQTGVGYTLDKNAGSLAPGEDPATHELYFTVTDWSVFAGNTAESKIEASFDFTVTVHAEQVD